MSINFGVPQENKIYNPDIRIIENEKDWLQGNDC